jgi:hypothetical protein
VGYAVLSLAMFILALFMGKTDSGYSSHLIIDRWKSLTASRSALEPRLELMGREPGLPTAIRLQSVHPDELINRSPWSEPT